MKDSRVFNDFDREWGRMACSRASRSSATFEKRNRLIGTRWPGTYFPRAVPQPLMSERIFVIADRMNLLEAVMTDTRASTVHCCI
jgi:hypothetical protein